MTREEAKLMIVSYMTQNPGSCPDYRNNKPLWELTNPIFDEMKKSGELVWGKKLSKTGRKMTCLFLKEFAFLSVTPIGAC